MAKSFLRRVAKEKKSEIEKAKKHMPMDKLLQAMLSLPPVRNFREALYRTQRIGLIAEIKKKAPGAVSWRPRVNVAKLAQAYEQGGACAISLVTDEKHFGCTLSQIEEIKAATSLPVLRKDFIVDAYQIYESRAARADALLLIAELMHPKELAKAIELTGSLGMTPVVEAHTAPDLKVALRAGADVILINNRDLHTLKVNLQTVERLAKMVPRDNLVIAASGYQTPEDVAGIASDRVRVALMGRAILDQKDPMLFIRDVLEASETL